MKRSEAVAKLISKVICPHVVLSQEQYEIWQTKADELLTFIEQELRMKPPMTYKISQGMPYQTSEWDHETKPYPNVED